MKKPFRRWLAALMAASMTLALTACSGGDNSSTAGVSGDKMFNVVMTSNYSGFDPLRTNDSVSSSVNNQIYETLYRLEDVMNGNLDEVIDALITADRAAKLESTIEG